MKDRPDPVVKCRWRLDAAPAGDRVGSIASGMFGDVVAVRDDPVQDVRRLQRVEHVVKGGVVVR